ncbi:HNH endonuclease domain-containing protein [Marinobacter sp. AN1]|uniref:HNH endonuclease domain-containing protein n=1 Tax=Marinobacter sp. AN1 TaxID=2886046 RepID=UPI0022308357|nr:HNH endonuclease domain-containing protein [Marinobacter sp. AN1]UZD64562.1 hypothetical protein LJ360_13165 [Marinobacter sp. AN1]
MSINQILPDDPQLNISALSSIFSNTTNSYKLLFFLAIMEEIKTNLIQGENSQRLQLNNLSIRMLQFAWYPHRFFNLSFGIQDKIARSLDMLNFDIQGSAITNSKSFEELRTAIEEQFNRIGGKSLERYVPYRLLSPFFTKELKGLPDAKVNNKVIELSSQSFVTNAPPIYRFSDDHSSIILHDNWLNYLSNNWRIVQGWVLFEWANYLQKKNPSTPAILNKLQPPASRSPLKKQTDYWNLVSENINLFCIYSNQPLMSGDFALDHFIPWSFICHDELWNLIPADPIANIKKGRAIPSENKLKPFIEQHLIGIEIHHSKNRKSWPRIVQPYLEGLSLSADEVLNPDLVAAALEGKMKPLMSLAKNLGYQ